MVRIFRSSKITRLQERLDRMREQRDWARAERDTSRAVTARIAAKFSDNHDLAWAENAILAGQVDAWSSHAVDQAELFTRAMRVRAAESKRLRKILNRQRWEIASLLERLTAQEDQLAILQTANEAHYRDLAARPARPRNRSRRALEIAS